MPNGLVAARRWSKCARRSRPLGDDGKHSLLLHGRSRRWFLVFISPGGQVPLVSGGVLGALIPTSALLFWSATCAGALLAKCCRDVEGALDPQLAFVQRALETEFGETWRHCLTLSAMAGGPLLWSCDYTIPRHCCSLLPRLLLGLRPIPFPGTLIGDVLVPGQELLFSVADSACGLEALAGHLDQDSLARVLIRPDPSRIARIS